MVNMAINDDSWFLVRETPGIGDFTGSGGKPTPMEQSEVERIIKPDVKDEPPAPTLSIPFEVGNRVRVKEGNFENFEGEVQEIDKVNGKVTVLINIFNRTTPVQLPHWHIEKL